MTLPAATAAPALLKPLLEEGTHQGANAQAANPSAIAYRPRCTIPDARADPGTRGTRQPLKLKEFRLHRKRLIIRMIRL